MYRKKRVFSTKDKYVKRRKINIFSASPPPKKGGKYTYCILSCENAACQTCFALKSNQHFSPSGALSGFISVLILCISSIYL